MKPNPILNTRAPFEGVKAALEEYEADVRKLQQAGDLKELSAIEHRASYLHAAAHGLEGNEVIGNFLGAASPADQGRFLLEVLVARFGQIPSVQAQRASADTLSEILGLFAQLPEAHAVLTVMIDSIRTGRNNVSDRSRYEHFADEMAHCGFAPKHWVDNLAEDLMRPIHF
jgi:hypothetical protein